MKLDHLQLRKVVGREEFDHLQLVSALSPYLAVDQKINELLKSGIVIRVKKGLYVFGENLRRAPVCRETLANLIYGPSAISLEYALAFHGFIPERVDTITSITPKRDKEFITPLGRFTYRYLRLSKYPFGIEQQWIDKQHPVFMACPEKALIDYVVLNGVSLATVKDARLFLEQDLRIDSLDWARFDLKKMMELQRNYRNKSVACLMEAL